MKLKILLEIIDNIKTGSEITIGLKEDILCFIEAYIASTIKENEIKHIWAGVEFGFTGYSNKLFNTTIPNGGAYALDYLRSNVVNINPFERNISLYKNYIALTTGIGFQFNRMISKNLNRKLI